MVRQTGFISAWQYAQDSKEKQGSVDSWILWNTSVDQQRKFKKKINTEDNIVTTQVFLYDKNKTTN